MKRLIAIAVLLGVVFTIPIPAVAGKWAKGLYAKSITDVYKVYYNRYTKGGKKGKIVIKQFVGDFSDDGLPEIVYGGPILDQKTGGQLYTRMKTFVISPSKKSKFSLYKPMHNVMPYSDTLSEAIIADLNGDKKNDLFIVDSGLDAEPFPGDQNVLVLSRGKRKFFNAKTRVPKLKDFSHGVGAGDVDGDGDIDLFIPQSRSEGSSHHYFLENRKGKFIRVPNGKWIDESLSKITVDWDRIPGGGIDRLSTAGIEDIDGDGQIDLVLVIGKGESLHNTRIVFGQKGKFKARNVVELPADRFFKNKSITRHYVAGDIDGNGLKDLILVHLADQGGSQIGTSLQVLVQIKKRKFKDKTKRYIPFGGSYKQGDWSYALHLADLNNDKRKDLIVQSMSPLKASGVVTPPRVFLQQKNKQFKPVPASYLTGKHNWQLMGIQPVDIDGDGQLELVGHKKFEASNPAKNYFTIQVVELTTKKTNLKIIDKTR